METQSTFSNSKKILSILSVGFQRLVELFQKSSHVKSLVNCHSANSVYFINCSYYFLFRHSVFLFLKLVLTKNNYAPCWHSVS